MRTALPGEQAMAHERRLRGRVKLFTWLFIIGLLLSGASAIPLKSEAGILANFTSHGPSEIAQWVFRVQDALNDTEAHHPFLFYGTDWLAFGHFVIAIAFIGALRDPVRNRWLFDFGLIACALVIPYALIFGELRGIPLWWRLIDCSFGVMGAVPLWLCRNWSAKLEKYGLVKS